MGLQFDSLIHLSYRDIKRTIPDLLEEGKIEEAILVVLRSRSKKLPRWRLRLLRNSTKLKFWFWVQDQYKLLTALEQEHLSSPPDSKLTRAGIHELDQLGDTNLIDALAGGNVLDWPRIMDLPYQVVFDKQLKTVIEARITKRLNKLK